MFKHGSGPVPGERGNVESRISGPTGHVADDWYRHKRAVNVARQKSGSCLASKTEDDNRGIR